MAYTIVFIVYLAGVIFGLAGIAYLNERKGEMYPSVLALASWWLLFVILIEALLAGLDGVCDFFCFLFRKKKV